MPDIAYEALIEHRQNTMGTGSLFTTSNGTPFYPRNILKYFQRELERLGLPKIPFHNLRHSCASFHLAAGTSPKFVQELLGHTTVAFTLGSTLICFQALLTKRLGNSITRFRILKKIE
jgi:integrase